MMIARDRFQIDIPKSEDTEAILALAADREFFSDEEIACVGDLWYQYCALGAARSGFNFWVYRRADRIQGFICYGPRLLTAGTFDLFWLLVDSRVRGQGIGHALLQQVEREIIALGGNLLFVETSGAPVYEPTRRFYQACGYQIEGIVPDFYHRGEALFIFTKHFA